MAIAGIESVRLEGPEWKLVSDVLFVPAPDGSARLFDLNGDCHAVSSIGAEMLEAVFEQGEAAAVQLIAEGYEVDLVQVQNDVSSLLEELVAKRLIRRHGRVRRQVNWLSWLLVPCLWIACYLPFNRIGMFALLALARFSFRWFGWSTTVNVWGRFFSLRNHLPERRPAEQLAREIDRQVRAAAAAHLFRTECKERALCCWAMARRAGLPASLLLGIQFYPLAGHCWCEVGKLILSDDKPVCDLYAPIICCP
jgi:hypothetical protein